MRRFWAGLAVLLAALGLGFGAAAQTLYEVPVLMYHRVEPVMGSRAEGNQVSPASFERQMEFLKVHGYRVMPLADVARALAEKRALPPRAVAITFDDGTLDNFRYAYPILKKMKFPATIFMITDNLDKPDWLSEEDLRILDESGVTIGSHTVHHAFLPEESADSVRRELTDSKARLEEILKHPVTLFSYPAGGMTPEIQRQVSLAGYEAAVTTNYGRSRTDPLAIHRIKIKDTDANLFSFWIKTSGFYHLGKKRIVRGE